MKIYFLIVSTLFLFNSAFAETMSLSPERIKVITSCEDAEQPVYCYQGLLKQIKNEGERFIVEGFLNDHFDERIKDKTADFMRNGFEKYAVKYKIDAYQGRQDVTLDSSGLTSISYTVTNDTYVIVASLKGFPGLVGIKNKSNFYAWYVQHLYSDFKKLAFDHDNSNMFICAAIWSLYDEISKRKGKDKNYINLLVSEYSREFKNGYYVTNFGTDSANYRRVNLEN